MSSACGRCVNGSCEGSVCVCDGHWRGETCENDVVLNHPLHYFSFIFYLCFFIALGAFTVVKLIQLYRSQAKWKWNRYSTMMVWVTCCATSGGLSHALNWEGRGDYPDVAYDTLTKAAFLMYVCTITNSQQQLLYIWQIAGDRAVNYKRRWSYFVVSMFVFGSLFIIALIGRISTAGQEIAQLFVTIGSGVGSLVWVTNLFLVLPYNLRVQRLLGRFSTQNSDVIYKLRRYLIMYYAIVIVAMPWSFASGPFKENSETNPAAYLIISFISQGAGPFNIYAYVDYLFRPAPASKTAAQKATPGKYEAGFQPAAPADNEGQAVSLSPGKAQD